MTITKNRIQFTRSRSMFKSLISCSGSDTLSSILIGRRPWTNGIGESLNIINRSLMHRSALFRLLQCYHCTDHSSTFCLFIEVCFSETDSNLSCMRPKYYPCWESARYTVVSGWVWSVTARSDLYVFCMTGPYKVWVVSYIMTAPLQLIYSDSLTDIWPFYKTALYLINCAAFDWSGH